MAGSRACAQLGGWRPGRPRHGLAAWHHVTRVEVPAHLRRDLLIGPGAPLLCYERALEYVAATRITMCVSCMGLSSSAAGCGSRNSARLEHLMLFDRRS